jgi:hypothetical protein
MPDPAVAGRTKRQRPEHLAQMAFVDAVRLCAGEDVQIWSIPNEHPDAWIGWLMRLGLTPGAPDLIVLWGGQVGFIEWKAPRGPISKSQAAVHAWLAREGFRVGVSRSQEEGWALLRSWGVPMRRQMLFDPSVGMVVKRPAPRVRRAAG